MSRRGLVGLVANPASGKDIRRLVAHAAVTGNAEKRSMVVRALVGIVEGGAAAVRYLPDHARIVESAVAELGRDLDGVDVAPVPLAGLARGAPDTTAAARALRQLGAGAVVTLGGDGTNRAFALGWPDAPLVAVSTGTNNAFPRLMEPTVAGLAAGRVASGRVNLAAVSTVAKTIRVSVDGEAPDLALIDAVLVDALFTGARALTDPSSWISAVVTRADPTVLGVCGVAGGAVVVSELDECALAARFGPDEKGSGASRSVRAAVAPGRFETVDFRDVRTLPLCEPVWWSGPALVALDGEREWALAAGKCAAVMVRRDGPKVIDVPAAVGG